MKKLLIVFLSVFVLYSCNKEEAATTETTENVTQSLEKDGEQEGNTVLRNAISELIKTGKTDLLDVVNFEEYEQEGQIRLFGLEYKSETTPLPIECCEVDFLGYDQPNLNQPLLLRCQERGLQWYGEFANQWLRWIIEQVDTNGDPIQGGYFFDKYWPSYASNNEVNCRYNNIEYGVNVYYPAGFLPRGRYKVTIEKGFTDFQRVRHICASDVGFAWYGPH